MKIDRTYFLYGTRVINEEQVKEGQTLIVMSKPEYWNSHLCPGWNKDKYSPLQNVKRYPHTIKVEMTGYSCRDKVFLCSDGYGWSGRSAVKAGLFIK